MVPGMGEPPCRYGVTVIVASDGGALPGPAKFAVAAEQAASSRNASVVSAYSAEQIISVVTVETADQPAAVAVILAVVSEALRRPVVSSSAYGSALIPFILEPEVPAEVHKRAVLSAWGHAHERAGRILGAWVGIGSIFS